MADDIRIRQTIDDQDVVNALERQIAKARELQNNYEAVGVKSKDAMQDVAQAARNADREVANAAKSVQDYSKQTDQAGKTSAKTGGSFRALIGFATKLGVVTAVASAAAKLFVDIFKKAGDVVDFLSDKIAFVTGAIGEFTSRMGGLINALFNGESLADASAEAFDGLGAAMRGAGQAAEFLNQSQRVLNSALDTNVILEASRQKMAQQSRQIAEDETRTYSQRIAALRDAGELELTIAGRRLELARRQLDIDQAKGLDQQQEAQRLAEISRLEAVYAAQQFTNEQQLRALRQERNEAARRQRDLLADLADRADKVRQQLLAMQDAAKTGLGAIQAEGIAAIEEINRAEAELRALYAERGVQFDLETEFAAMRAEVERQTSEKIIQYRRAEAAAQAEEAAAGLERQRQAAYQRLDLQEQLATLQAETAQRAGLTEVEATRAVELEKLNIQRQFQERRLALIAEEFGPTSLQASLVRQQIELIRQEYNSLANAPLTGLETFGQKVINALGITPEQADAIGEQLKGLTANVADAIVASTEAQISQQDNLIKAIEDRISETEKLYDEELRRQEQGLANNAAALKENLDLQNQEREKAEAKRLQLEKRAARQRLAIDAAQQASAYITTVTRLLAAEASKGLIGLVTGLAGIALLARIIATARSNSQQFQPQGFRDGTEYVTGPGTRRSDSIPARLSVGERVLPAGLNEQLGGRSVSNEELVRMYQIGKALSVTNQFANSDAALSAILEGFAAGTEQREAIMMQRIVEAHERAADRAAEKTINYWKTRPVDKIGPEGPYTEWTEGNTIKRVKKADA